MKSVIREVLETLILAVVIFFLVHLFIQNFRVEGSSMEPSLHDGVYILVNKAAYWFGEPRRGDVVVLELAQDPTRDRVKRVIGLPGEKLEIKGGKVYIDDSPLEEPYLARDGHEMRAYGPIVLSEDQYFVMGDNRTFSLDSRSTDWGPIREQDVVGKAWLIIWGISEWGLVPNYAWGDGG